MSSVFGINVLDLLGAPPGTFKILPPAVSRFVNALTVVQTDAATTTGRIVHAGVVTAATEGLNLEALTFVIPGLTNGLPFRFFVERVPVEAGEQIENQSGDWVLQIDVPEISIRLPFEAAQYVPETTITPAHLQPYPQAGSGAAGPKKPDVQLEMDAGVLEVTSDGELSVRADFAFSPDPSAGSLARLRISPSSFFIFERFGANVGEILFDLSTTTSPTVAREAGFGDDFRGAHLKEVSLFFPRDTPLVGKFLRSATLRDALIGDGFAGEASIEFGPGFETAPPVPTFFQVVGNEKRALDLDEDENTVEVILVPEPFARVIAVADVNVPWRERRHLARWVAPDGETHEGARTPPIEVRPGDGDKVEGDTLIYGYESAVDFQPPPERTIRFRGVVSRGAAARLQLRRNGRTFDDVTFIAAPREWLQTAELRVTDLEPDLSFSWLVNTDFPVRGSRAQSGDPAHFDFPDLPVAPGQRVGVSAHGHRRMIIVDVLTAGSDPVIVSERQAVDEDGNPLDVDLVYKVYHLPLALAKGELRPLNTHLPAVPVAPGDLQPGKLYAASAERVETTVQPGTPQELTIISVFYDAEETEHPDGYQIKRSENEVPVPSYTKIEQSQEILQVLGQELKDLEEGTILVVGRTSRTSDTSADPDGMSLLNRGLQDKRADNARALVTQALQAQGLSLGGPIQMGGHRGERTSPETDTATWDKGIGDEVRAAPKRTFGSADRAEHKLYQRADIYIRKGAFKPPSSTTEEQQVRLRILIPGPPSAPSPPVASIEADRRWRARLLAQWDREPWPVKSEVLFTLEKGPIPVPIDKDLNTEPGKQAQPCDEGSGDEFWRFLLRLVYDQRSGRSRWTGSWDAAGGVDGLAKFCDTGVLGLLLLMGPVLASDPPVDEVDGATLRFLTASALVGAAFPLTASNPPVIDHVDVTLNGVSFEAETLDGPFADLDAVRFKLDYSVVFSVDAGLAKTKSGGKMRIRYTGVGLELRDVSVTGSFVDALGGVDLFFDPAKGGSVSIEDSGAFEMDSNLGKLLSVTGARIGHGSLFMELDMAFSLDLGVVEVSKATLRILFGDDGPSVELRGLGIGVEIPEVVKGTGSLVIGDGGALKSELDLQIIPAGVHASGRLELFPEDGFTAIALGIDAEFATGLPIPGTTLGVYGLFGRFAGNMRRQVDLAAADRVAAELAWLRKLLRNQADTWLVQRQTWALGVGAVVGTLADSARAFHAKGGLVLEIPGPTLIFGLDARFLSQRRKTKDDDVTGTMTGLALVDPFAYLIGIEVDLRVGDFLVIHVPIGAFFPRAVLPNESEKRPSYVRIGSDGVENPGNGALPRSGSPARAEIVAGAFGDVARVFSFLMIEERNLLRLYNRDDLNFHGFSIGFGAGIQVRWGNDAVSLRASALLVVGLSTSPRVIAGEMTIEGELRLWAYSLEASADLDFRHDRKGTIFDGEFCGKISFFFFDVEGCVHLELGDGDPFAVPEPAPLVSGLSLVDRRGQVIRSVGVDPEATGTLPPSAIAEPAWPDAVPVLHFAHEPKIDLQVSSPFADRLSGLEHSAEVRSGDFRYRFTLKDLRLEKREGGSFVDVSGPLDAAWWFPSWRPAFLDGDAEEPSGEEARELGLLTWHPALWARSLTSDQHDDVFEEIGQSIDNVCDPKHPPTVDCALWSQSRPGPGSHQWRVRSLGGEFRAVLGGQNLNGEFLPTVLSTLRASGYHYAAAHLIEWAASTLHRGHEIGAGLRLSRAFRPDPVSDQLRTAFSFDTRIDLSGEQRQPELLLALNVLDLEVPPEPDDAFKTFSTNQGFPQVMAVVEGAELEIPGQVVGDVQTPHGGFLLILYRQEDPQPRVRAWHILPFGGEVQVVAACGQDYEAFDTVQEANEDREDWQEDLGDRNETGEPTASQFILDADSEYRVTAVWEWVGWHTRKEDDKTDPESVTQTFTFRTAPAIADPESPLTALEQQAFDPRALSSYVVRQPSLEAPPTFLDDPVTVGFSVDHVEPLLERYGRALTLEVLRTDLPAAPVEEGGGALSVTFAFRWQRLLLEPVDLLLADKIAGAPCLGGATPPLGGVEAVVQPNLAPNARYDLVVYAANDADPDEPRDRNLIVRAPFTSSRYRSPDELFQALGFGPPNDPGVNYPSDALFSADFAPPFPTPKLGDDTALAETMAELKLDTLEPPAEPRTTLLWRLLPNGLWQVFGLLLDAPEPIERPGRLQTSFARVRSQRLDLVRSSASGTRLLFLAEIPAVLPLQSESNVDVFYTEGASGPQRRVRRVVLAKPVAVLWEV